ncbi:MAG: response regulator, partial [Nitrospirota bacterium]|nr:response regulator [Nitrospirota bacterium]
MKTLIAEDNADDRKLLRMNLEHHGCVVFEAGDGAEALHIAKEQKPDLIISDALMPKMDGFQFLRAVKTDEALRHIPFIFYSAVYTGYREAELAISLGAAAFIIKPKEPEELWNEIRDLIDGCKLKDEGRLTARIIEEDEEFLNKYSQIVASKLEEKMKELKTSEEKYRALVEHSLVGVYQSTIDGRFIYVNNAMIRIFEFDGTEEMMAADLSSLYKTPEDRIRMLDELHKNGKIEDYELEVPTKKGNLKTVKISATLRDNLISGVAIDITEQKKLEAQLRQAQKMEAVGQLTGGIAHDFNNILSAIVGYGGLLQMKMKEDDPLRPDVDHLLAASERAATLTQSLLAFSRKQMLNPKPISLNGIVKRMKHLLGRVIGEDIDIRSVLTDEDCIVMADSGQIDQVLMNLATNARDAMPHGGSLTIETGRTEFDDEYLEEQGYGRPGTYAFLSVSDTGIGMDEETRRRVFEPFFTTKE